MPNADFWPVIAEKHKRFFALTDNLGPTIDKVFGVGMSEPLHKVWRYLAKMTANSLSAVTLLGLNGFGIDALKVARSMFEVSVVIAYLRRHPEEVDDYLDFHFLVAMKRHRYMEKYAPHLLTRISPEAIAKTQAGFARVVHRFTHKGRVRGHWCNQSFAGMCADADPKFEELYLTP